MLHYIYLGRRLGSRDPASGSSAYPCCPGCPNPGSCSRRICVGWFNRCYSVDRGGLIGVIV
jgi:hypothetical protein